MSHACGIMLLQCWNIALQHNGQFVHCCYIFHTVCQTLQWRNSLPNWPPSISPRIPTHLSNLTLCSVLVCFQSTISRLSRIVNQNKVPTLQLLRKGRPWDLNDVLRWSKKDISRLHKIPKIISMQFNERNWSVFQKIAVHWWIVDCALVDCMAEKIVVYKCKVIPPSI